MRPGLPELLLFHLLADISFKSDDRVIHVMFFRQGFQFLVNFVELWWGPPKQERVLDRPPLAKILKVLRLRESNLGRVRIRLGIC